MRSPCFVGVEVIVSKMQVGPVAAASLASQVISAASSRSAQATYARVVGRECCGAAPTCAPAAEPRASVESETPPDAQARQERFDPGPGCLVPCHAARTRSPHRDAPGRTTRLHLQALGHGVMTRIVSGVEHGKHRGIDDRQAHDASRTSRTAATASSADTPVPLGVGYVETYSATRTERATSTSRSTTNELSDCRLSSAAATGAS